MEERVFRVSQGGQMPYTHLLVAVAPTPESQVLIKKAVSIARPVNAKVSLKNLWTLNFLLYISDTVIIN